jgi:hypothetical protein
MQTECADTCLEGEVQSSRKAGSPAHPQGTHVPLPLAPGSGLRTGAELSAHLALGKWRAQAQEFMLGSRYDSR